MAVFGIVYEYRRHFKVKLWRDDYKKGDRINDLDTGKVYNNPEKLYVILDGQKVIRRYTEDELKKLKNIGRVENEN